MNIFQTLYDFALNLSNICSKLWEWLNKDFEVNILGFNVLNLLGIETFKPIQITGAIVIVFMVAYIIKKFIPGT